MKYETILNGIDFWVDGYINILGSYRESDNFNTSMQDFIYYGSYSHQKNKLLVNYPVCKIVSR